MNPSNIPESSTKTFDSVSLDQDLREVLDEFNSLYKQCGETRMEISQIESQNKALQTELDLLKSHQFVSEEANSKISEIQKMLTRSTELLEQNQSSKEMKVKLKKMKNKIMDLEMQLAELKDSHIKELFQVEIEKEQITSNLRKEVDDERNRLKQEGVNKELTDQINELEARLKSQAEESDNRLKFYQDKINEYLEEKDSLEGQISLIKEENARLRERIKKLEMTRSNPIPASNDSNLNGNGPRPPKVRKINKQRKVFNPLAYDQL
uniref:CSON015003 protein n=1 Tax=Culicoides sonorensis TaxID=179676 RepID=A0A336MGC5_CULSO